jgi:hypothetical protein
MFLFFLPPVIQVAVGIVTLVIGLALLHSVIIAGAGVVGVSVGAARYVRSRRPNGFQR